MRVIYSKFYVHLHFQEFSPMQSIFTRSTDDKYWMKMMAMDKLDPSFLLLPKWNGSTPYLATRMRDAYHLGFSEFEFAGSTRRLTLNQGRLVSELVSHSKRDGMVVPTAWLFAARYEPCEQRYVQLGCLHCLKWMHANWIRLKSQARKCVKRNR